VSLLFYPSPDGVEDEMNEESIEKTLGGQRQWTQEQVKRAARFAEEKPREWWAFGQIPTGALRTQYANQIANGIIDEKLLSYLFKQAARHEDSLMETAVGASGMARRPRKGDLVEVVVTIDRVILYSGGEVELLFPTDTGWRGSVRMPRSDYRLVDIPLEPDVVLRVRGVALTGGKRVSIGDKPGRQLKDPVERVLTLDFMRRTHV
jgi:hypothetical protein